MPPTLKTQTIHASMRRLTPVYPCSPTHSPPFLSVRLCPRIAAVPSRLRTTIPSPLANARLFRLPMHLPGVPPCSQRSVANMAPGHCISSPTDLPISTTARTPLKQMRSPMTACLHPFGAAADVPPTQSKECFSELLMSFPRAQHSQT